MGGYVSNPLSKMFSRRTKMESYDAANVTTKTKLTRGCAEQEMSGERWIGLGTFQKLYFKNNGKKIKKWAAEYFFIEKGSNPRIICCEEKKDGSLDVKSVIDIKDVVGIHKIKDVTVETEDKTLEGILEKGRSLYVDQVGVHVSLNQVDVKAECKILRDHYNKKSKKKGKEQDKQCLVIETQKQNYFLRENTSHKLDKVKLAVEKEVTIMKAAEKAAEQTARSEKVLKSNHVNVNGTGEETKSFTLTFNGDVNFTFRDTFYAAGNLITDGQRVKKKFVHFKETKETEKIPVGLANHERVTTHEFVFTTTDGEDLKFAKGTTASGDFQILQDLIEAEARKLEEFRRERRRLVSPENSCCYKNALGQASLHSAVGVCQPESQLQALESPTGSPMLGVTGGLLLVGTLLGCYLKRRFFCSRKPRRDSFGFLPDSRRASLNDAERMV